MSMNVDPNASFSLSTWILKSPTIRLYLQLALINSTNKNSLLAVALVTLLPWFSLVLSMMTDALRMHVCFVRNT